MCVCVLVSAWQHAFPAHLVGIVICRSFRVLDDEDHLWCVLGLLCAQAALGCVCAGAHLPTAPGGVRSSASARCNMAWPAVLCLSFHCSTG